MHPDMLSRRLSAVDNRIVSLARQLAEQTEQAYEPPQGFEPDGWSRNGAAPLDLQLLYHAEVVAAALALIVAALPIEADAGSAR